MIYLNFPEGSRNTRRS